MSTSTSPAARLLKSVNQDPLLEGDPMHDAQEVAEQGAAEKEASEQGASEQEAALSQESASYQPKAESSRPNESAPQTIALPLDREASSPATREDDGPGTRRFDTFFDAVPSESPSSDAADDDTPSAAESEPTERMRSESSHNTAPTAPDRSGAEPAAVSLMAPSVLFTPPPLTPTQTVPSLRGAALRPQSVPAASAHDGAPADHLASRSALPAPRRRAGGEEMPSGDGAARPDVQPPGSPSLTVSEAVPEEAAIRQAVVPVEDANAGILGDINDLIDDGWRLQRMDVEEGSIVRIHLVHRG